MSNPWLPIETLDYRKPPAAHFLIKAPSLLDEDFNPDGVSLACIVVDDPSYPLVSVRWNATHDCYCSADISDATHWKPIL